MGFKACHPTVNILFYISVAVFGMLFKHPVCIAVSLCSSFACYVKLRGKAAVKTFCLFLLPMLLFVAIINSLFAHYGVTPLLTLPDENSLTLESIVYGFVLAVSVVSVIMWMFCYNEVVTADKFMHVFGKKLPAVALVVSMALRFVPMYKTQFNVIAQAQRGLGLDYKTGSIFVRIKNTGKILSILLSWALENAIETADSMRARGYGLKGRKTYSRFRWSAIDVILCIFILIADLILALAVIKETFFAQYNPYIVIKSFDVLGYFAIIVLIILSFLPLIVDLKEEFKWYRLKSKI